MSVTITWCDAKSALDASSHGIQQNGIVKTASFTYTTTTGCTGNATSTGTVMLVPGVNTVWATICDIAGNCGSNSVQYAYNGDALLSLAPHNGDNRDVGLCASSCFDAVAGYSTASYVSMNAPRSVQLLYRSAQAKPMATVVVDARDTAVTKAGKLSVLLRRSDGTFVTFTNGSTEIYYGYTGTGDTSRLAAQYDASADTTGAYNYTLLVRYYYASSMTEVVTPVRVLVANQKDSTFGWGWSVAGLQRLSVQADGGAVITDGTGAIAYFRTVSCPAGCIYSSPAGDFTTLVAQFPVLADSLKYQRKYPNGTSVSFRTDGRMAKVVDRFGNTVTYGYDAGKRVVAITDPAGKQDSLGYVNGKLRWIRDPGGRVDSVTIDAALNVTQIKDAAGVPAFRGVYDASHRLQRSVNRRGDTLSLAYDFAGKLAADTLPRITADGVPIRPVLGYGSFEKAVLVDPASGKGTATNPGDRVLPGSVRASVTDARGSTTAFALDRFGAPILIEEPLGRTTAIARDANSHVTRTVAPSGHIVKDTWSGPNLIQVWDSASTTGRQINYTYESTYNEVTQVSGDADSLFNYWSGGHLDSTVAGARPATNPLRRKTTFTYDALGRLVTTTDPAGHADTTYYDGTVWRNSDSTRSGGRRVAYTYDGYGRLATMKTPQGDVTTILYDVLNRRTSVIGPLPDTTTFTYDALFLTQVRDAIGQTYEFAYNGLGWLVSRTDPIGKQDQYQYDKNGNPQQWTNRRNQVIASGAYDALNRPTTVTADAKTTKFAYDAQDRFAADSNAESIDTVKFDVAGRPTSQISVRTGTRYELVSHANLRDLRDTLRSASPWADTIAYHYNASFALDTLRDLAGGRTAVAYDHHLLDSAIALPNGLTITGQYPATHTTAQVGYSNGPVDAAIGAKYDYDSRALVATRHNVTFTDGIANTGRDYSHDALGRLTRYTDYRVTQQNCVYESYYGWACGPDPSRIDSTQEVYSYDKVGNRTDLNASLAAGNRLIRFNGDSLVYDDDGNLITRIRSGSPIQRLYWSSVSRLDSVWTNGVGTVSFGYDGVGRRVRKTLGTTTTRYLYDVDNLLAEVDGGAPTTPLAEYTYYPGIDRPHSLRRRMQSDSVFYYAQDFPGNVVGLVNGVPSLVAQYKYKPYGVDSGSTPGNVPNPFRFAARQLDTETGLYYMRARYYDPALARFVSEDPLGLAAGINPYAFAGNSPVNARDPSGEGDCLSMAAPVGAPLGTDEPTGYEPIAGSERTGACPPAPAWVGGGSPYGEAPCIGFEDALVTCDPWPSASSYGPSTLGCIGNAGCTANPAYLDAVYHAALSGVNLGLVAAASAVMEAGPYTYERTRPAGPGTGVLDCSAFVVATISAATGQCRGNFGTASFANGQTPPGFVPVAAAEPFDIVVMFGQGGVAHMGFYLGQGANGGPIVLSFGNSGFSVSNLWSGGFRVGPFFTYRFVGP